MRLALLTAKWFLIYVFGILAVIFSIALIAHLVTWLDATYGSGAIKALVSLVVIVGTILSFAYMSAVNQLEKEKVRQDHVLNSLKKDWD